MVKSTKSEALLMSPYFSNYLATFQRVKLGEMLEAEGINARKTKARASLVVNPLTGRPYAALDEGSAGYTGYAEQCVLRYGSTGWR